MARSKRHRSKGTGSVYQTTDGLWRASIELPPSATGKRRRKVVSASSHAAVLRKLREAQRDLARDGDVATTGLTVAAWAAAWMRKPPRTIKPRTLAAYRTEIDRRIVPTIGRRPLAALKVSDVTRLHAAYDDAGLSGTTKRFGHATLRVLLTDAVRAGHMTRNVADTVHIAAPKRTTKEVELPSLEQLLHLTQIAAADPVMGPRWLTTIYTGLRRGETLGLAPEDIDANAGVLRLRGQLVRLPVRHGCDPACGATRAGDCPNPELPQPLPGAEHIQGSLFFTSTKYDAGARTIPLVEPLAGILAQAAERRAGHRLLWCSPSGGVLTPEADNRAWQGLREKAGLSEQWKPHHARHAAATLMMAAGQPDRVISTIVGHSSVAMTRHYQHVDAAAARRAMEAIAEALTATT